MDLGYTLFDLNCLAPVYGPGEQRGQSSAYCILADHPTEGKILIDCGFHPQSMLGRWPEAKKKATTWCYNERQNFMYQLLLCGVDPKDINTVILTHMHQDHIGCLYLFPHAKIYMPASELKSDEARKWLTASNEERANMPSAAELGIHPDLDCDVHNYVFLKDEDYELCRGIKLISLPGHTMGTMGVEFDLENSGIILYASDALMVPANYGPPTVPPGKVADMELYMSSVEKCHEIHDRTGCEIWYGHHYPQFKELRHAPEYYD